MRKELYKAIVQRLLQIGLDGELMSEDVAQAAQPEEHLIRHVDLWNHNVEFLEQEESWPRPAVFVEFAPVTWECLKPGNVYRSHPVVTLHVVTDWQGGTSAGSEFEEAGLSVLDYSEILHRALHGLSGASFSYLDLQESHTNHNHEDLVESLEVYRCTAKKELEG